jgi:hypothetical protein
MGDMRPWVIELAVDRGIYRLNLRTKTYEFVRPNPDWSQLSADENARNKRQLHGMTRTLRDGKSKLFIDRTWAFTEDRPCPTCFSWLPRDSPCDHAKYECPTCGRRQCLSHWPYPMRSRREALHFLKGAQVQTGKACFVRSVGKPRREGSSTVWKVFTSEDDFLSYMTTGKHRRN